MSISRSVWFSTGDIVDPSAARVKGRLPVAVGSKKVSPRHPYSWAAMPIEQKNVDVGGALPPLLKVEEIAHLLRLNIKTVYAMIARDQLPGARQVGRVIRISRDPFLAWLAGSGTPTKKEVRRGRRIPTSQPWGGTLACMGAATAFSFLKDWWLPRMTITGNASLEPTGATVLHRSRASEHHLRTAPVLFD